MTKHSHNKRLHELMTEALEAPITYEDFASVVSRKAPNKSAGISEFTINMLKAMPESLLRTTFDCMNEIWIERALEITPESWHHRWLAMVPKQADSAPPLDQIRPISLYEVLRKVWTTIITARIVSVWDIT